jgi:hypothetical protein
VSADVNELQFSKVQGTVHCPQHISACSVPFVRHTHRFRWPVKLVLARAYCSAKPTEAPPAVRYSGNPEIRAGGARRGWVVAGMREGSGVRLGDVELLEAGRRPAQWQLCTL